MIPAHTIFEEQQQVDYTTDGNKFYGKLNAALASGTEVPITVKFSGNIELTERLTLIVDKGLSVTVSGAPATVNSGDVITVNAPASPALPAGASFKWTVTIGEAQLSVKVVSEGTATVTIPSDSNNGSTVVIKVQVQPYGTSGSVTASIINKSQVPVNIYNVQDVLNISKESDRTYVL